MTLDTKRYMATEIVRDLLEPTRYNLTDKVATVLGVDKEKVGP